MELTDAETVIKRARAGTMIYGRVKTAADATWQTVLYIREDNQQIKAVPPNPTVEMRAGVMDVAGVILIPILIKIAGELYESWLNYHATGGSGQAALQELATQEQNVVLFFGDSLKQDRSIGFRNSCAKTFALVLEGLKNKPAWTMQEFDQARDQIYTDYPSIEDLWRELA